MITRLKQRLQDVFGLLLLVGLFCGCEPDTTVTIPALGITITQINATTIVIDGTATNGGGTLEGVGVVYSPNNVNTDPLLGGGEGVKQEPGVVGANFTVTIGNLKPGTAYAIKTYAKNQAGTGYSDVASPLPVTLNAQVADPTVANYIGTGADLGGNILSNAGGAMIFRGVVYAPADTNSNPEIGGAGVFQQPLPGGNTGPFSVSVTGLTPGTRYAYRAYGLVGADTVYSEVAFFPETTGTGIEARGLFTAGIAVQPDGRVFVGGNFNQIQGELRKNLVLLRNDGTVDPNFTTGVSDFHGAGEWIQTVAVQRDGKILIGGVFNQINGAGAHPNLARLNPNGTVDTTFLGRVGAGNVDAIAIQPDGKILVGGYLINLNGNGSYFYLGRLLPTGALDTSFIIGHGPDGHVSSIAVLPSGKILIAGGFTEYNNIPRSGLARLNPNGSLDTTFDPVLDASNFAALPDGKILIAQPLGGIARLAADGTHDTTFGPAIGNVVPTDQPVQSIAVQADGKIILGGAFTMVDGNPINHLARLNPDGSFDPSFTQIFGLRVSGLALREDGKLVVGGDNSSALPGSPENVELVGLLDNDPATSFLIGMPNSMEWFRSQSQPEVTDVRFELSTNNGATWSPVGNGIATRSFTGWEKTGVTIPAGAKLRARGRTVSGQYNGGSGLVETNNLPPPAASTAPTLDSLNSSNILSTSATTGAEVTSDGGATVLERGILISRTVDDSDPRYGFPRVRKLPATGTTGAFTVNVTGLAFGTHYTFKAFARNAAGIGYSINGTLVTDGPPKISAPTVTGISDNGATLGGTVEITGASLLTEKGVGYRRAVPFTDSRFASTQDFAKIPEGTTGTGTFTVNIGMLDAGTEYDFVAYATNNLGTVYTTPKRFMTTGAAPAPLEGGEKGGQSGPESLSGLPFGEAVGDPPGTVDAPYDPSMSVGHLVQAIALQTDGKSVVAGNFKTAGGQDHEGIARVNTDGTIDANFNPSADGLVNCLAVQNDGRIVLGGAFSNINGNPRNGIARLNADGTIETSATFNIGAGADNVVYAVALQPDGKILIGGLFTQVQGTARKGIARLFANGLLDPSFNPGAGASDAVYSIAVQTDGKIVIGGVFQTVNGVARNRIARLTATGAVDTTFNPPGGGVNDRVTSLALQKDGKVLLGGFFTVVNGVGRNRIARLNANGTLDTTFTPGGGADNRVYTLALQSNGKVVIGGLFQNFNGIGRNRIARLNANGTLDTGFNPGTGADNEVDAVAVQEDGSLLVGGLFQNFNGVARRGMVRLSGDAATQSLTVIDGTQMRWLRSGGNSELSAVRFQVSVNGGATWTDLGPGVRIVGGWAATRKRLPRAGLVRVLGKTAGGFLGNSSGLVQRQVGFTHVARVANLQAQLRASLTREAALRRQIAAARRLRQTATVNSLTRQLNAAIVRTRTLRATLAKYP